MSFRWNDFEQMHTTTLNPGLALADADAEDQAQAAAAAAEKHLQDQAALIARIFGDRKEMDKKHLAEAISLNLGVAPATAYRRLASWLEAGMVQIGALGKFSKAPSAS